jgi:hypothetical protein
MIKIRTRRKTADACQNTGDGLKLEERAVLAAKIARDKRHGRPRESSVNRVVIISKKSVLKIPGRRPISSRDVKQ